MEQKFALLVVDLQKAYFRNEALRELQQELIARTNELVRLAHDHELPVIVTTTAHKTDRSTWTLNMLDDGEGYLFTGDRETHLLDGLELGKVTETVKTRDSAFFDTGLSATLKDQGVSDLIISGVSTHTCVGQTAADAYAENFRVVLATDAIASHDPKYHGCTIDLLEQEYRQQPLTNTQIRDMLGS